VHRVSLGDFELTVLSDGPYWLDGGAMFGVVPKPLWSKKIGADDQNRITLGLNSLLIRTGEHNVLVETGIGPKLNEKSKAIYGHEPQLMKAFEQAKVDPETIDVVINTHLHFDHCGWNTREAAGKIVPTFPQARYFLARGEVEHARHPNERDRASYMPRNWEPLFEAGVAELFDDEVEPLPGVRAVRAPGHNRDLCIVLLDGGGPEKAVFWADLVPTTAHVPLPWIMGYDLYPLETLESKKRWLPQAAAGRWLGIFEHDADVPLARVVEERPGRFKAEPVVCTEGEPPGE
jgi:glyoxylase-like metal-dependent hydrolase (beta-lactamase superfamily II)